VVNQGNRSVVQVLVKWSSSPASLATWEDLEPLRQRFSKATAWGQAVFQEGGDVTDANSVATKEAGTPVKVMGCRVSRRARRPSVHLSGPEWCV
jgi:hypothetical protein